MRRVLNHCATTATHNDQLKKSTVHELAGTCILVSINFFSSAVGARLRRSLVDQADEKKSLKKNKRRRWNHFLNQLLLSSRTDNFERDEKEEFFIVLNLIYFYLIKNIKKLRLALIKIASATTSS